MIARSRTTAISAVSVVSVVWPGLLALCAVLAISPPALAATAQADWRKIQTPPLRKFAPQQPTRLQLDNGLVIFLQPDTELPLVNVTLSVHGGSRDEPADQVGLVSLFSQVRRTGGILEPFGDGDRVLGGGPP